MLYSSIDNKKIKEIKKLNTKKYRDLTNTFIIEGEHLLKEAYLKGYLKEMYKEESNPFKLDVPTSYVTREVLKYITSLDNPNVIGICEKKELQEIGDKVV